MGRSDKAAMCPLGAECPAQALVHDCDHPQRMGVYFGEIEAGPCRGMRVGVDVSRAIRDPLFWLDMIISRLSFGLIEIRRWERYVTVRNDDPQPCHPRPAKPPMPPKRG